MRMGAVRAAGLALLALSAASAGCEDKYKDGTALHARTVVLRREVEGLRRIVARLERREPLMPPGDVALAIEDTLVRDLIAAQLPLDLDAEGYHVHLSQVDVAFRGNAVVRLRGTLTATARMGLQAEVDVIGALDRLEIERERSTLSARIAIDHVGLEKAAGIEAFVSGSSLSELGRMIRLRLADRLPVVQIPIRVQQTVELPAVTRGAVRIEGASMPLGVAVSQVTATRGRLWVALHFEPGDMTKAADAPEARDATAAEAGVSLDAPRRPAGAAPAARSPRGGR